MRRREFFGVLGGSIAAWPLALRAQQPERVRRIGVLYSLAEDDPESVMRRAAFERAIKELGWINGGNLRIDYRWARNDPELIRKPLKYFTDKEDQPPFLKALAEVRRIGVHEGWCYHHVRAILLAIDQYAEAATGNREFFWNKPHSIGGSRRNGNIP
jgi:hypothetical protein